MAPDACPSAQAFAHVDLTLWAALPRSKEICQAKCTPPSALPNVSPDCTSQGPWKGTIGFVLPTFSDESQDGCCGLFLQLKKRKMIHIKRRHQKLSIMNAVCVSILSVARAKSNCPGESKRAQPVQYFLK